jgi:hypothetical protein
MDKPPGLPKDGTGVSFDVAAGHHLSIGSVVIGQDPVTDGLECIADPRRAGKQVDHGPGRPHETDLFQDFRNQ